MTEVVTRGGEVDRGVAAKLRECMAGFEAPGLVERKGIVGEDKTKCLEDDGIEYSFSERRSRYRRG